MHMEQFSQVLFEVVTWNANAGTQPSNTLPERNLQLHNQLKLVIEELKELQTAVNEENEVEIIDAICDINVVASYGAFLASVPIEYDDLESVINNTNIADVVSFDHSDVVDDLSAEHIKASHALMIDDLEAYNNECIDCLYDGENASEMRDCLAIVGQALYAVALKRYGKDVIDAAMRAVLDTNNAKFLEIDEANEKLERTIEAYKGRYSDIVVCETPLGKACYRCDNGKGKILKPFDWTAPDIQSILNNSDFGK